MHMEGPVLFDVSAIRSVKKVVSCSIFRLLVGGIFVKSKYSENQFLSFLNGLAHLQRIISLVALSIKEQ